MIVGMNLYTVAELPGALGIMILGLSSTYPAVRAFEKGRIFMKWYLFSFSLCISHILGHA